MIPKKALMMLVCLALSSCAGAALQKEWEQQRGYTPEEIALTEPYREEYKRILASATVYGGTSVDDNAAQARVRTIFCACVKKLGSKCQQRPVTLVGDERVLWAKGNGAEMALRALASGSAFDSRAGAVDTAECM